MFSARFQHAIVSITVIKLCLFLSAVDQLNLIVPAHLLSSETQ